MNISLSLTNTHPLVIKTRRSATWMNELNMCGCAELMRTVLNQIGAMPEFSNYTPRRSNLTALGLVHTYPDIFLIRNFFFPDTASVDTYLLNPAYESAITNRTVLATKIILG